MAIEQFPTQIDPTPPVTTIESAIQPYATVPQSTPSTYPQGGGAVQPGMYPSQMELDQQGEIDAAIVQAMIDAGFAPYDSSPEYRPLARLASDPRFAPPGWTPDQGDYEYTGAGLVNDNGQILTRKNAENVEDTYYYDPIQDGFNLYISQTPAQRLLIMRTLNRKGFATETIEQIAAGYAFLHEEANKLGVSVDVAVKRFSVYAPDSPVKTGATYRISAPADIKSVAQQTAIQIIGREMPEQVADAFVSMYQKLQRAEGKAISEGGEVMAAPSISAAAEQFAKQRFPNRADAYETLNYMDMFFNAAKGL